MSQAFRRHGRGAVDFDILNGGRNEDLASWEGFSTLMWKAMRLMALSLIVGGPPCSMFIFFSCSQHRRHDFPPFGDPRDTKTQLANCLAANTVFWIIWMIFWIFWQNS